MQGIRELDLINACRILFGSDIKVDYEFLQYIQLSGVKSAYRKKALVTHPDRFIDQGEEFQKKSAESFREATSAYKKLCSFLKLRPKDPVKKKARNQSRRKASEKTGAGFNKNTNSQFSYDRVPKRELRIGEFLYYSGIISWEALILAIVSQKRERKKIGQIAKHWGWLTEEQIRFLLIDKGTGELFGDVLLRNGLITEFQLNTLLHQQQVSQKNIGEYLISNGDVSINDLEKFMKYLKIHNLRHGTKKKYSTKKR
ncbi:MAG: hypothetical protein JSV21_03040 [Nitrospirota bacterium]|nr:MAG: hypothetical protein JSV21_03040 [Nitrospirota bacterium]